MKSISLDIKGVMPYVSKEEQEIFAQGEKDLKQWQIRLLSKITQKGQNQSFTIERLRRWNTSVT